MRGQFEDFIGIWDYALPEPNCTAIIEKFNVMRDNSSDVRPVMGCDQMPTKELARHDYSYNLHHLDEHCYDDELGTSLPVLNQFLNTCLGEYLEVYGSIKSRTLYSHFAKIQHTPAGGGYHVWHDELGDSLNHTDRVLVWMIYLNEDFEGGETEFLYQKRRIKPTTGTCVIWPAYFTHHHRGGLVLNGDKYIATGWYHQKYSNI